MMIRTIEALEENLSRPTDEVVRTMSGLDGDLMVLGAGGKMGPSLARMAARAVQQAGTRQRVLAVSRFSDPAVAEMLQQWGIDIIRGDLLDAQFVDALPEIPNLIYMAGRKFGTEGAASVTWASNTYLPGLVGNRFRRSRIVAFSTGNVYRPMPVDGPGSLETDRPEPHGEYGMSCLGRERIFEYFSGQHQIPLALIRLNYATELRYGVLVDLAEKIMRGEPIPLAVGYFNVIWQADANAMALCALRDAAAPPFILNVTGPHLVSCRQAAERLAELMGKSVTFEGVEGDEAPHTCAQRAFERYGEPRVSLDEMLVLTANWIGRGGPTHGKPTHFEVTDGKY